MPASGGRPILVRMLPTVFAHETWFGPDAFPTDWGFAAQTLTLVLLAGAVLVTVGVRLAARAFGRPGRACAGVAIQA
jgi:hypothetical protein